MSNGKGDRYRDVDRTKWDKNWERIFGKKTAKKKTDSTKRGKK